MYYRIEMDGIYTHIVETMEKPKRSKVTFQGKVSYHNNDVYKTFESAKKADQMKTQAEKDALKKLKSDYKKHNNRFVSGMKVKDSERPIKSDRITTGIMPSETILEDSHAVHPDYLYVVDDNGGKVIRSDVSGNVLTLKRDLQTLGYKAENIYRCSSAERNLF